MSAAVLPALALVAALYATVGHAGASGYIAVLTLAGMAAPEIRPLALLLNVLVASLATRHASLEDVFVSLTGRHLRDE